jgi:hypothetical protein
MQVATGTVVGGKVIVEAFAFWWWAISSVSLATGVAE